MKKLRKEKNVKKETAHENAINVNSIKKSISGKEKVKSEKVEKKSKIRWLWLLNPNNLAKEIHVYGYDFSWLTHAFFIIGSVIGISAIGLLYKLRPEYLIIAIIVAVALIPMCIEQIYKQMFEQKRFADVLEYMDQMLYSFQKTGKILSALQETRESFKEGNMKECIDKAIEHIIGGKTFDENGALEKEALEMIEEKYMCDKIVTMHDLLYNSEDTGGDNKNSILLMLEDIENWKKRGYTLLATKKTAHIDNIISIGMASALTLSVLYTFNYMNNNVHVSLAKSMKNAPVIIQKELEKLMERLEQNPDSIESYGSFFKEFDAPEIQSCMKMLYSISENGVGDSDQQIKNLIESVNKLQGKADELNNESIAFKMKMIFTYPVLVASLKLLVDMTVGLLVTLQILGQLAV